MTTSHKLVVHLVLKVDVTYLFCERFARDYRRQLGMSYASISSMVLALPGFHPSKMRKERRWFN